MNLKVYENISTAKRSSMRSPINSINNFRVADKTDILPMDQKSLYVSCTLLGTLIFVFVFLNYYLGAIDEETNKKTEKKKKN